MNSHHKSISESEIYLRVAAPVFFEDLIGAHTASLIDAASNPEQFAAWKQERSQKDREFAALSADELLAIETRRREQSFDIQSIEFTTALQRFSEESQIPFERDRLSPEQMIASYAKVIRDEWEVSLSDMEAIPEDMRFVAAREIEESKVRHHEEIDAARHSFGEMSQAARDEFLEEQRHAGQRALKAQEQSLQQTQDAKLDPPKQRY